MPNIEDFLPMEWNVSQDAEPATPVIVRDIETNSVNLGNSHFKNGEVESWIRHHLNSKIQRFFKSHHILKFLTVWTIYFWRYHICSQEFIYSDTPTTPRKKSWPWEGSSSNIELQEHPTLKHYWMMLIHWWCHNCQLKKKHYIQPNCLSFI